MRRSIKDVKKRHEASLLQLAGVASVGIGLDPNGRSAIIVGLDRPNAETETQIPAEIEGYPIRIRVVGTIKAR
jgi:hypothetical protein